MATAPAPPLVSNLPLPPLLRHPVRHVQTRFQHWWEARIAFRDSMLLTQRNVYILPTPPGWMLAATLMVLLVASINYQLNLGYLLTFLLAGSALVGMHLCHGTLRGITLTLTPPDAQFAGTSAVVAVRISSERKRWRYGLGVSLLRPERHWSWTDVPPQGSATVHVAFKPERRGLHRVPTLTVETRFPLGTFRVWTVWRPAAQVLVYPAPEALPPPLPPGEPRSGAASGSARESTGEYDGVRAYRRGDPLKLVVWKKLAKADELVSRDAQQHQQYELWLDVAQCGVPGPVQGTLEARLSRLCAWVQLAEKQGLDYGLRLQGAGSTLEIPPAHGQVHERRCLEALALC